MSEITIPVLPEIADAYRAASEPERQRLQALVSVFLQKHDESDVTLLRKTMDELSEQAQERGLTPDILASILNEH